MPFGYTRIFGAIDETRTRDLVLTKDALYQLSYDSICKLYRVYRTSRLRSRTRGFRSCTAFTLKDTPHPYLITTVLLRNSDKYLISWLDLSKEYIGGTLGSTSAPTATCRSPIATTAGRGYIFSLCTLDLRYLATAHRGLLTRYGVPPVAATYLLHFSALVRMERLELSTTKLKVSCSTTELHPHIYFLYLS